MIKKALACLCLVSAFSLAAFAQGGAAVSRDPEVTIRGKLIFSNVDSPENRIEVKLEKSLQQITNAFTDSAGNFEFRGLTPGLYYILVTIDGYDAVRHPVETLRSSRTENVAIVMTKAISLVRKEKSGFEGDDPDIVDVKLIAKTYPKKAVQAYEKGLTESEKGQTAKAVKLFEEAIGIAADFYHAYNNLGVGYMKLNRHPQAEGAFKRALELNPRAHQPLLNLGILYMSQWEAKRSESTDDNQVLLTNAREALEQAARMRPLSAITHYQLGTAYYKSESYDVAESSLKRAHELDPKLSNARLMLVNVYLKQKRWNDLIQQIDAHIQENPASAERPALQEMRQKVVAATQPTKP